MVQNVNHTSAGKVLINWMTLKREQKGVGLQTNTKIFLIKMEKR